MTLWAARRQLLLPAICVWLCSASARAQLSPNPGPGCSPDLACDKFKEMAGKRVFPKVVIDHVTFDGPIHLPDATLKALVTSLTHREFDGDPKWLEEIEEVPVRSSWQDQGYFTVAVKAQALPLGGDANYQHFSVTIHVDERNQYRIGTISFRSADPDVPLAFPAEELQKLISLKEGDLVIPKKIRNGLEALKKFYDAHGYIDFTATPFTDVDESTHQVSLRMELEQQRQYRIGSIDTSGLDQTLVSLLESRVKSGDLFCEKTIKTFLDEHRSAFPPLVRHEEIILRRDDWRSTVDLRFGIQHYPDPDN
jgi:outer membrane protein assembly factor BamA